MPSSNYWYPYAYGNGTFVAGNQATTTGAYSTNGTTWTSMTMPSTYVNYYMTFGNGYFVASTYSTGYPYIAYSTNGYTWSTVYVPFSYSPSNIVYNNGVFIIPTTGTTWYRSTNNGASWSSFYMPTNGTLSVANGYFIITSSSLVIYSSDGFNWNESLSTLPTTSSYAFTGLNGLFIGVVTSSSGTKACYATNINGTGGFTAVTLPNSTTYTAPTSAGPFVIMTGPTGYPVTTTNGFTWTVQAYSGYNIGNNGPVLAGGGFLFADASSSNYIPYWQLSGSLPVNFGIYNGPTTLH
jgi:hypothetical protein